MTRLQEFSIPTPVKLGLAWAAMVLCYIYCDYFALYIPGKLAGMQGGEGPIGPVSQWTLLIAGIWLVVPALMSLLSVCLRAAPSRFLNLVFGAFYCLAMIPLFFASQWYFYKTYLVVEAVMAAAIFWMALKWPRVSASPAVSR